MYKIILIILLSFLTTLAGEEWTRLVDLRGQWKFNLGDNLSWADPDFNDEDWENIFTPSQWEDEGFPGYDGYAWYRTEFSISNKYESRGIYIRLWQIDDVDEVYINGHFVGFSGSFPPNFSTVYSQDRTYYIPQKYLNFDKKNIVAVRVFDKELGGGIIRGRIGLYSRNDEYEPDIHMDGLWKFKIGDDLDWKEYGYNDMHWDKILVPAPWETQGYKDYDGYAWYRTGVIIPDKFRHQELILMLGKIDDIDEVYFNGKLVGSTGRISKFGENHLDGYEYAQWRAYPLDPDDILYNSENIVAVRVFDGMIHGGIYQGPVGIITSDKYGRLPYRKGERKKSIFELIFDD